MTEAKKHPGGRPRKYSSPKEMQKAIDKYFDSNDKPTMCGLAINLGFTERQGLWNYQGYSQEFFDLIKRARIIVEASYERDLRGNNVAGCIFALKQFKWRDRQDLNLSGDVSFSQALSKATKGAEDG